MQKREKCDVRYVFKPEEKAEMLKKSGGICVHCGKKLKVNSKDLTAEHIIPLSKGGKNNLDNLIALCKTCNHDKGNDIVWVGWYKYASPELEDCIKRMYRRYFRDYSHLDNNHFTKCDRYGYYIDYDVKTGDVVHPKAPKHTVVVQKLIEIKRAMPTDLSKLEKAYEWYNKAKGLNHDNDFVHSVLTAVMSHGCIWYYENSNGVQFVIPMLFTYCDLSDELKKILFNSAKSNFKQTELSMIYVICLRHRNLYYNLLMRFIHELSFELCDGLGVDCFPLTIDGFDDGYIGEYLEHYFGIVRHIDDIVRTSIMFDIGQEGDETRDVTTQAGIDRYVTSIKKVTTRLKEVGIKPISGKDFYDEIDK